MIIDPIVQYHAFNERLRLRQLLPRTSDCLLQFSDTRKLRRRCDVIKADDNE